MKIAVFGMGYVGSVTAGVFAREGHEIVGIDPNPTKIEMLRAGRPPVSEPELDILIERGTAEGRLRPLAAAEGELDDTDIAFVCVGTPSAEDGSVDTRALLEVGRELGRAMARRKSPLTVALRSTTLPEIVDHRLVPAIAEEAGIAREQVPLVVNPEFLREGAAIKDFDDPPFTLLGTPKAEMVEPLRRLYGFLPAPILVMDRRSACLVKYTANAFHALKVAFANEVGAIARRAGVDGAAVMEAICADDKLNISKAYLRPGMPFGGSCLPKDLRALVHFGKQVGTPIPLLASILESNHCRAEDNVQRIAATGKRKVGIFGLSFKAGTDDLRESPAVTLVERLVGDGFEVTVYDPRIVPKKLLGANREQMEARLPGLPGLLRDTPDEVLREAECLVRTNTEPMFETLAGRLRGDQVWIDLTRAFRPGD